MFPVGPTTTVAPPLVNQKPGRSGRKIVDRPASVTVVEPSAFAVMNAVRLGGGLTVLLLGAAVIRMLRRERRIVRGTEATT